MSNDELGIVVLLVFYALAAIVILRFRRQLFTKPNEIQEAEEVLVEYLDILKAIRSAIKTPDPPEPESTALRVPGPSAPD